jgi:hypothetical protein
MLQADGASALYIEGLSIRSESVAETRGRGPLVPERAVAKTSLPAVQDYARDQGAADDDNDDNDARAKGNPDE